MLSPIAKDPRTVVCPVIDVISDDTFEYHYRDSSGVNVGGFDWNLQVWLSFTPHLYVSRHSIRVWRITREG